LKVTNEDLFFAIVKYKRANDGVSPSFRELADLCGYSSINTVQYRLNQLQEDGLIEFDGGVRSIKVAGGRWVYEEM